MNKAVKAVVTVEPDLEVDTEVFRAAKEVRLRFSKSSTVVMSTPALATLAAMAVVTVAKPNKAKRLKFCSLLVSKEDKEAQPTVVAPAAVGANKRKHMHHSRIILPFTETIFHVNSHTFPKKCMLLYVFYIYTIRFKISIKNN